MAKEKFDRSKPHVNVGTIGHIDHGKTTLTAAITKVLQKHNPKNTFRSFDSIDNAPRRAGARHHHRDGARWKYGKTANRHYCGIVEIAPATPTTSQNMITGAAQMMTATAFWLLAATDGPDAVQTNGARASCQAGGCAAVASSVFSLISAMQSRTRNLPT